MAKAKGSDVENGKGCAILSYLLIGIIWYFADEKMKKNTFAQFHARQGLVLLVAWIIVAIVSTIFWLIPFVGWVIGTIVWICFLVLMLLGIINAANGNEKELPVIGQFAKNFPI